MKKYRKVYVVKSLVEDRYLIFSSYSKAKKWIEKVNLIIFNKSKKSDLYISKRTLF